MQEVLTCDLRHFSPTTRAETMKKADGGVYYNGVFNAFVAVYGVFCSSSRICLCAAPAVLSASPF